MRVSGCGFFLHAMDENIPKMAVFFFSEMKQCMFEVLLRGVRDGVKICPLNFVVGMIDLRRKKCGGF